MGGGICETVKEEGGYPCFVSKTVYIFICGFSVKTMKKLKWNYKICQIFEVSRLPFF